MNLPDLVRQYINEEAVAALANTLGEPVQRVSAATSAAIPALICFYADSVSRPEGAARVHESLASRGGALLDHLPQSLTGEAGSTVMDEGMRELERTFGKPHLDHLANAISRFSGLGIASSRSVLGTLNAVTLATINKHASPATEADTARYIAEARQYISQAIPAGLHEYLDEIPEIKNVIHSYDSGAPATATDDGMEDEAEIPRQENLHNEQYYEFDQGTMDRTANLAWVVPLLIAIVVGVALVYTLMPTQRGPAGPAQPMVVAPPSAPEQPVPQEAQPAAATLEPQNPIANIRPTNDPELGADLSVEIQQFTQALNQLKQSSAAAPAAQTRLAEVNRNIQTIQQRASRLPADQRQQLSNALSQQLPSIQSVAQQALPPGATGNTEAREMASNVLRQLEAIANQGR